MGKGSLPCVRNKLEGDWPFESLHTFPHVFSYKVIQLLYITAPKSLVIILDSISFASNGDGGRERKRGGGKRQRGEGKGREGKKEGEEREGKEEKSKEK